MKACEGYFAAFSIIEVEVLTFILLWMRAEITYAVVSTPELSEDPLLQYLIIIKEFNIT